MASSARSKVALVIVNYNSWDSLRTMLASMVPIEQMPDIYVIDNASPQPVPSDFLESAPVAFEFVRLEQNLGYTGAAAAFLDRCPISYDWVFVANPDLVFVDAKIFSNLAHVPEWGFGNPGIYAPRIIDRRTQRNMNPHRQRPLSRRQYLKYRLITSSYFVAAWAERCSQFVRRGAGGERRSDHAPQSVFAVHGSFFGVSRRFLECVGVATGAFLFCEEELLGFMCRQENFAVIYDPSVRVLHEGHVTTGYRYSRFRHRHRCESLRLLKPFL